MKKPTSLFLHGCRDGSGEGEVAAGVLDQGVVESHMKTLGVSNDGTKLACAGEGERNREGGRETSSKE